VCSVVERFLLNGSYVESGLVYTVCSVVEKTRNLEVTE